MEYETLEREASPSETNRGIIKHNEWNDRDNSRLFAELITEPRKATEPATDMADQLLIQPEVETEAVLASGVEIDVSFGAPLTEKPLWKDLYESIQDVFFPPQLPPLELTSTPIPVPDRMAVKANPLAIGTATFINLAILAAAIFFGVKTYIDNKAKTPEVVTPVNLTEFKAPKAASMAGGGGGSPDKVEAIKGKVPPKMTTPDIAPKVIQPPTPTIDVQKDIIIPDDPKLPNFGMANSSNVKLASGGAGSGMGMGNGHGNGYGDGSGGNIGGGLYHVGGGVSAPVALFQPEAEFSDEARRAKYQGVVVVSIIVDAQGNPQNPRVVRALGMGLDEKAVEAVKKYKFKPAMKDGKTPVPVMVSIEVNFRLY